MPLLTIVADDLTGALDTSVKFCGQGRVVSVCLVGAASEAVDVLAIDTDSRELSPAEAAARVSAWAKQLRGPAYKKVDSTLRGPFAAESWALARVLGATGVLLAQAAPAVGGRLRTVVFIYVAGRSVRRVLVAALSLPHTWGESGP